MEFRRSRFLSELLALCRPSDPDEFVRDYLASRDYEGNPAAELGIRVLLEVFDGPVPASRDELHRWLDSHLGREPSFV